MTTSGKTSRIHYGRDRVRVVTDDITTVFRHDETGNSAAIQIATLHDIIISARSTTESGLECRVRSLSLQLENVTGEREHYKSETKTLRSLLRRAPTKSCVDALSAEINRLTEQRKRLREFLGSMSLDIGCMLADTSPGSHTEGSHDDGNNRRETTREAFDRTHQPRDGCEY